MKNESPLPAFSTAARFWPFALVLVVFAAGLLCIMPNYQAYYFGDEHFYTDSAIRMVQTGHTLTPAYADGTPRFNKPVLSYWMILAGFRAFGISVLASRLASLLAGLAILLLAGLLARRLFDTRAIAFATVLVLASNLDMISASMRATPDVFLTLSALMGLTGFAGLLLDARPRPGDAWCAYIGAGLAVASKGMLGLLLLAFALLFALARRDRAARLRALWRPAPMLVGLALALAWFVAVYVKYGDRAIQGFLHDQVGSRISTSFHQVGGNLFSYTFGLALSFFPWSILLLAGLACNRQAMKRAITDKAPAFLFILAWYGLLLIVFSPANLTRTRYLLPAFPLLASGAAALIVAAFDHPALARTARRTLQATAILLVPLAVLLGLMAVSLARLRLGFAGAGLFLLAAVLLAALRHAGRDRLLILFALATFVVVWDFEFLVRPAFPSTPAYAMTRVLRRAGARRVFFPRQQPGMTPDQIDRYKEKYASQVRLISGGTIRVDRLEPPVYLARASTRVPMICVADDVLLFPSNRFRAVRAGSIYKPDIGPADIRRILAAPRKRAALNSLLIPYYIVFPTAPPADSAAGPVRPEEPAAPPTREDEGSSSP
jgi:4-amino-4-deoxy-L-arabinose transferase-like glycosyltransferase